MTFEKRVILLASMAVVVFAVVFVNSLEAFNGPITNDDAVEISKNAELVKSRLPRFPSYARAYPEYLNYSQVQSRINEPIPWADPDAEWVQRFHEAMRKMYGNVPEGHSIWEVTWIFSSHDPVSLGESVIVIVDAETGTMLHEECGIGWD